MKLKLNITEPCGLTALYELAAKEHIHQLFDGKIEAVDFSEYKFDCTKIDVANNIQDMFYEYYTDLEKGKNNSRTDNDIRIGITMILAIYGPKVNEDLADNEVEIFDGFLSTIQN
jgi:hypothetical protein